MSLSQIRASGKGTLDLESLHIRSNSRGENGSPAFDGAGPTSQANVTNKGTPGHNYGRFDASALHIAHALRATQIQKAYKKEKPLHTYLVIKKNIYTWKFWRLLINFT